MKPADALTHSDRAKLQSDNFPPDSGVWSILLNYEHVSLHVPEGGGWVEIPHDEFRRIAEWYLTDQPEVTAEASKV